MKKLALVGTLVIVSLVVALAGCRLPLCPANEDPTVVIDKPPPSPTGGIQMFGKVIMFRWHSGLETEPRFVRWFCSTVVDTDGIYNPNFNMLRDLNENPWRYEEKWSKWVPYRSPQGRTTTIGDDETLQVSKSHIFAVQAMDFCGRVTKVFDAKTNVRRFIVSAVAAPVLKVYEPSLCIPRFLGCCIPPPSFTIPSGFVLNFHWEADASAYGGEIAGYRYGWDVADINDPSDWEVRFSLEYTSAPPKAFASGVHTFYVEAIDNAGMTSLGRVELNVIPFTMERNLLWVDDVHSTDFTQIDWAIPTETQHDQFWLGNCSRAIGFDPARDVYDVYYQHNIRPPEVSLIARYKNIIWSYSSYAEDGAWDDVIYFTPESLVGSSCRPQTNYVPFFLAKGGHLLTEGRSDRGGGLAACLLSSAQVFPMSLRCEITGPRDDCSGDRSGVNSMPYRDYCVSMLDKVLGAIRQSADMPMRKVRNYDAMTSAYKADDPAASGLSGLPDALALWEEVTKPGRYFDPMAPEPRPGGFTFVEIYDPAYWMGRDGITSQPCFHPLYRMKTKSSMSALDNTAIALCLTKYENVVPQVASGIAVPAKSFHFGTELWYFNPQQVNQIVNVIFGEWQIKASQ